jgi:hypothetical protein
MTGKPARTNAPLGARIATKKKILIQLRLL